MGMCNWMTRAGARLITVAVVPLYLPSDAEQEERIRIPSVHTSPRPVHNAATHTEVVLHEMDSWQPFYHVTPSGQNAKWASEKERVYQSRLAGTTLPIEPLQIQLTHVDALPTDHDSSFTSTSRHALQETAREIARAMVSPLKRRLLITCF